MACRPPGDGERLKGKDVRAVCAVKGTWILFPLQPSDTDSFDKMC